MPYYWTCPGEKCDCKDNEKEDDIHDGNENHR